MIEAPFALFEIEVKVLARDAIETAQIALGLVPEVLDPVDVIDFICEQFRMVYPHVVELGNVQHVISSEAVCVDDRIWPYLVSDNWKKRVSTGIWNDHDVNLAAPLQ